MDTIKTIYYNYNYGDYAYYSTFYLKGAATVDGNFNRKSL